jgi:hypothetical protein
MIVVVDVERVDESHVGKAEIEPHTPVEDVDDPAFDQGAQQATLTVLHAKPASLGCRLSGSPRAGRETVRPPVLAGVEPEGVLPLDLRL